VFDKTAHILKEKHFSMASLYFSPKNGAYHKEIGAEIKYFRLFSFSNRTIFVLEMMPKMTFRSRGIATLRELWACPSSL
jgi:hypothetical protein